MLAGELYYIISGRDDELCSHNFKGIYFVEITLGYVLCGDECLLAALCAKKAQF